MAPEQDSATAAGPNERGEVTLPLEGQEYHLRPSRQAISAIEAATGRSLFELADAARQQGLTLRESGIVAAEMMRAYGRTHPDDPNALGHQGAKAEVLEDMIHEAGIVRIQPRLAVVLFAALTGGVDKLGETKPAKEKP